MLRVSLSCVSDVRQGKRSERAAETCFLFARSVRYDSFSLYMRMLHVIWSSPSKRRSPQRCNTPAPRRLAAGRRKSRKERAATTRRATDTPPHRVPKVPAPPSFPPPGAQTGTWQCLWQPHKWASSSLHRYSWPYALTSLHCSACLALAAVAHQRSLLIYPRRSSFDGQLSRRCGQCHS